MENLAAAVHAHVERLRAGEARLAHQQIDPLGAPDAPLAAATEAFDDVLAPAHVHAGLVELQLHPPRHQPVQRHVDRHAEVHGEVRPYGKAVQVAHPAAIDAARHVAREGRERVAIGQHDHARLQRRHDVVELPVGEVSGV